MSKHVKDFNQLINLNRNKLYEDDENNFDIDDVLKKDLSLRWFRKVDFLFKYNDHEPTWMVYSLSKVIVQMLLVLLSSLQQNS